MGTTRLNKEAYRKLIAEDLQWLYRQPETLESKHIAQVLGASIVLEYPHEEYAIGDVYTRDEDGETLQYALVGIHATVDQSLDGTRSSFTMLLFRSKKYPMGGDLPVPAIDCDHERRVICR
jgi:hypothetical protein